MIPAGAGGAFDLEIVAVVVMELLQRLDDQVVDREPDRPAPVRVAAEHARIRFARLVATVKLHGRRSSNTIRACRGDTRDSARTP